MSVIVKLKGGLGNQLFIWAAGYSLARRLGVGLIADVSSFHDDRFGRKFELDNLNHGMVGLLSDPEAVAAMTEKHSTFTESGFAYDPLFETCQDNTVLDGHFQSYRYFWEYKSEIIAQLMSSFNFTQEIRFLESIPNRVHLHYRLGDYLTQAILGVLSPGYFAASLRRSGEGGPIILFSDEAKRALDLLPRKIVTNSLILDNGGAFELLFQIASSENLIASNSTLSWWAGVLVLEKNGNVFVPQSWQPNNRFPTADLYPPDFIQVRNDFLTGVG